MTLTIASQARRRRILRATALALAAAASVLLVVRATRSSGRPDTLVVEQVVGAGSVLVRAGTTEPLADMRELAEGDVVRSNQNSSATLLSGRGTHLTLSSAAQLRVDQLGTTRRFLLASGRLQARVAKLGPGERFLVTTPDSEVEVRGTAFGIFIGKAPAGCRASMSQSTVQVSEGAVWVRAGGREVLLQPGDSFTPFCADTRAGAEPNGPTAAPGPAESHPAPAPARPAAHRAGITLARPGAAASPRLQPAASEVTPSTEPISRLAEQNDLFSKAMAAERRGQHDLALRQLDDLIGRFPSGPLRESAQAERQRILSASPLP
jgi:ferric-dicitrate binding protein FerR (iron transport regulator)